jgi:type II secretory ATPase GspE/PulE/Tfp pilus assembly ATPase PilB-like protein
MNAELKDESAIHWPPPPFFRCAEALTPGPRSECSIEFVDGSLVQGELVEFQPSADFLSLRVPGSPDLRRLTCAEIRCITLAVPVAYVADAAALAGMGAASLRADSLRSLVASLRTDNTREFVVDLEDGQSLVGKTLGFVKEAAGVFLYRIENDAAQVVNCFIPSHQIRNLQIGPLIGAALLEQRSLDIDSLTLALDKQAELRREKIGKQLTDQAIISAEELLLALREQGKRPDARLGDLLIESSMITTAQLDEALAIQSKHRGRRIGDILIEMGAVSARMIQVALSSKLGIPFVNVREFPVSPDVLMTVETEFAIRHQVLPLVQTRDSLVVAVENPLATDFLEDLRFRTGLSIDPVIANPQDLKARISKEYSGLDGRYPARGFGGPDARATPAGVAAAEAHVAELTSQLAREMQHTGRGGRDPVVIDSRVSENTLVRLVNKIIIEAHAQGASDIHIESNLGASFTCIRFRKDGELEHYLELPQTYSSALVSRIKIMAELDISEHRHPQDGKIDFSKHGPLAIELRVAVIPTANGLEDVVLRILAGAQALPLDGVGFSDTDLPVLKKMISRSYGLILVCGPTGSGKTTTLHSLLREINTPDVKIWTAEDPIEITQPGLRQVQVQPKIEWTFAAAMRAFLRADPDVIMVGEMRDVETAKTGIEASLTGHLVFSTLHTNSAVESVVRLLDLGMDPFNFADALIGILSQRLARKLCLSCRKSHVASKAEIDDLLQEYCLDTNLDPEAVRAQWQADHFKAGKLVLREAVGCEACKDGYKGRVMVYELLTATPQIKHLVRSRAAVPELTRTAQGEGMISLRQNAIDQVLRGTLDLAGARAVAS